MEKILILEKKTAPFILLYIARPESVCDAQGRVFSHMSLNLHEILGESFLNDIHEKVMNYVHAQLGQSLNLAIDLNVRAEQARRRRAEDENVALRQEVAQLRAQASQASASVTVVE
ncbi:hypothetical protein NUW54_g2159 [Trametes sanguinea]|uniref:Uncharacterized protein n=1 Tax=Trametes sanguinea TaxID=158606 RepID=A0ACC1Q691_9APHY|nr:hypothetical protein NUW54_g2159 [Trametes sanguinea]